jgi:hypothetical protein
MAEANHRLQHAPASDQLRATMSRAVVVLAQQRAVKEAKAQLRDRGLKPQHYSHREIVALAEEYLAQHREELIKEAKETILRWQAGGMFGPRGGASLQDPDREGREAPSSWLRRERKTGSERGPKKI